MTKQIKDNNFSRLFVRIIDRTQPIQSDEYGRRMAFTKWVEVGEVTLGSIKNPNREVLEFKFVPFELEPKEKSTGKIDINEIFKRFGLEE